MTLLAVLVSFTLAASGSEMMSVRDATRARLYFEAGSADGLALGTTLRIARGKRALGSCVVDNLAEHSSSCAFAGGGLSGDSAAYVRAAVPGEATPSRVVSLPAPPSELTLRRAEAVLADDDAPFDYEAKANAIVRRRFVAGTAGYAHQVVTRFDGRDFQVERIEVGLAGTPLGFAGFRAFASAALTVWSARPSDARFRPGVTTQLYVWQLQLSSREIGRPFTLALGRVLTEHAPGLAVVDGAQGGWRSRDGRIEVGAIAGGLPDAVSNVPNFRSWIVSAYYAHSLGGASSTLRTWTHELRLGLRGNPSGIGLDLAGAMQATITKRLSLHGSAQLSYRPELSIPIVLSFAAVQAMYRPIERLSLGASMSYLGPAVDDDVAGKYDARRLRSFADVHWRALSWLGIGLTGGVAHDLGSLDTRGNLGPEIVFPTGFFGLGIVSVGYREELGAWSGRNVYAQIATSPARWHVLARVSYTQDRLSAESPLAHEMSVFARADLRVTRWLSLRATTLVRGAIVNGGATSPIGLNAQLGATGYF